MAGGFGTSVDTMQTAGSHVFDVNEAVQGQLSTLKNQLAPLAGAWTGNASTAFQTLMVRWDENARSLNDALRAIGEAIQASGVTYDTTDQDEQAAFTNLGGPITQGLG